MTWAEPDFSGVAEVISNAESGERAEQFVVDNVRCPYCGAQLRRYGGNRPLRDVLVQQVRLPGPGQEHSWARSQPDPWSWSPDEGAQGIGRDDSAALLRLGVDRAGANRRRGRLFPFLPWSALEFRVLPDTMKRPVDRGRIRVEYHGVPDLPRIRLYPDAE